MRPKPAPSDSVIARLAAQRHGVVTTQQLADAGIDSAGTARRVRAGRLHRLHRGVYAVGHRAVSREGHWLAAVLACGDGAVLSHRAAAAHWGLLPPIRAPVDVTVPGHGGRGRRRGIAVHRSRTLAATEITRHRGVPITTPARTIADLRRAVSPPVLRRAVRQAEVLGLPLGLDVATDGTRSELERDFLRLCRRHRLPVPEVNVRVGPFLVDFVWREHCIAAETDGYRFHRGRQAFEDDRARDLELRLRGYEVIRFSHRQVSRDPAAVAAALRPRLTDQAKRPYAAG